MRCLEIRGLFRRQPLGRLSFLGAGCALHIYNYHDHFCPIYASHMFHEIYYPVCFLVGSLFVFPIVHASIIPHRIPDIYYVYSLAFTALWFAHLKKFCVRKLKLCILVRYFFAATTL